MRGYRSNLWQRIAVADVWSCGDDLQAHRVTHLRDGSAVWEFREVPWLPVKYDPSPMPPLQWPWLAGDGFAA